ncbi:MAG: glucosaminidase domain-containing protein [Flavobacteriaceae bacterium]|nr:glucosaminidase domain-containing protein [Flavobacteriaceae bacterium]
MNKKYLIVVVFVGLLVSCGTSRRATSTKSQKSVTPTKEEVILAKSDVFFSAFKKRKGGNLNRYTLDYIDRYKYIAIEDMMEFKIPASITLAQGVLESGSGRSELARMSNNHFGIKCHKGWTGKNVRYDDDKKRECFRKYAKPEDSFDDHSSFLTTRSRYDLLFELKADNYKAWAKGLKKAGYATDRKYPSKLIKIIEDYELYVYDDLVLNKRKRHKEKFKEYRTDVTENNHFILVKKGDTLYSISRSNNITVYELKKINDLDTNEINIGQKLYISK